MTTRLAAEPQILCKECGRFHRDAGLVEGLCAVGLFAGLDLADETDGARTRNEEVSWAEGVSLAEASAKANSGSPPCRPGLLAIPGYTVVAELARGGMGIVYRARQHAPDREVAIKMLLPFTASAPELRERFQVEVQTLSELDHPAILPIYETGEYEGLPWFSMKLATGGSLAQNAANYRGRWREIVELMATLADAAHFAHEHGVLHRDLKPGNILFDGVGRQFVADFGLAKLLTEDRDVTRSHLMMGTPNYLAPEVAASSARNATIGSDVYSLGAVFFELLTGRPPFKAEGLPALLSQIVADEPQFPATGDPHRVPADLQVIARKCLAKNPVHRYASARELAEELRRYLNGEPILARPARPWEKLWRWSRREPALAAALAACALILVSGVTGMLIQLRQTEAARSDAVEKAHDEAEQRTLAETARARAEWSEIVMRQNLYAADMLGVQRALEQNDFGTARVLLDAHRPAPGQTDLRGFEWRYYWGRTRGENFALLKPTGHEVTGVVFSTDGTKLAFGSRQAFIHALPSLELLARAEIPSIQSLAFLPGDRDLLLGIRGPSEVWRWSPDQHGRPPTLLNPGGRWPNIVVSPRGDIMAIGTGADIRGLPEGSTSLCDVATGVLRQALPESGGMVAFSRDGSLLATGSWLGSIKLWDPMTGNLVRTLPNATRTMSLSFSPDGRTLAVCSYVHGVLLFDVATGVSRHIAEGHTEPVWDAEFSPDGRTLATSCTDQTVRLWDAETGKEKRRFLGHSYTISHVAWSPDGKVIASGGQDGTVRLWNVEEKESAPKSLEGAVTRKLFFAEGRMVVSTGLAGKVTLHEYPSLKVINTGQLDGTALGFETGGKALVTLRQRSGQAAAVMRWSIPELQLLETVALPDSEMNLRSPVLSIDGRTVAAGVGPGEVALWELEHGAKKTNLATGLPWAGTTKTLAFSPDGRLLAGAFHELTVVHIWDLSSPEKKRTELHRHRGHIVQVMFSRDGRTLVSTDSDKYIKLWDVAERKERATLLGHRDGIVAVEISADDKTLVSSSEDLTVRFWNLPTHREVGRFEMKQVAPTLAFAPDDALLVAENRSDQPGVPYTTIWRAASFAETDRPSTINGSELSADRAASR